MKKIYPILGVIAPLIYFLTVILGSALRNDYSQFSNTISELSLSGAPNLVLISILFSLYNISLFLFGIGALRDESLVDNKKYKVATLMIALIGLLGGLLLVFPQDPRGSIATLSGTIHIIIAGIISPLTIIAVFLTGWSLKSIEYFKKFSWYSYISTFIIAVSGGLTAFTIATNNEYGGLMERITIFTFILWVLIFSILLNRAISDKKT